MVPLIEKGEYTSSNGFKEKTEFRFRNEKPIRDPTEYVEIIIEYASRKPWKEIHIEDTSLGVQNIIQSSIKYGGFL